MYAQENRPAVPPPLINQAGIGEGPNASTVTVTNQDIVDLATAREGSENESWTDIDAEDSKAIEAYLAASEENDLSIGATDNIGMARGSGPPRPGPTSVSSEAGRSSAKQTQWGPSGSGRNRPPPAPPNQPLSKNGGSGPTGKTKPSPAPRNMATGGARPKGNFPMPTPQAEEQPPRRVLTRGGWYTEPRKRKRTTSSPNTQPAICGGQVKPYRDVFVAGLKADLYDDPEEMKDALQDYCEARGVDVYFINILNNSYGDGFANAKLTIATADYQRVISHSFWPADVFAREWYVGNKKKKAGGAGGDK